MHQSARQWNQTVFSIAGFDQHVIFRYPVPVTYTHMPVQLGNCESLYYFAIIGDRMYCCMFVFPFRKLKYCIGGLWFAHLLWGYGSVVWTTAANFFILPTCQVHCRHTPGSTFHHKSPGYTSLCCAVVNISSYGNLWFGKNNADKYTWIDLSSEVYCFSVLLSL